MAIDIYIYIYIYIVVTQSMSSRRQYATRSTQGGSQTVARRAHMTTHMTQTHDFTSKVACFLVCTSSHTRGRVRHDEPCEVGPPDRPTHTHTHTYTHLGNQDGRKRFLKPTTRAIVKVSGPGAHACSFTGPWAGYQQLGRVVRKGGHRR
jgi:hypothetical protein